MLRDISSLLRNVCGCPKMSSRTLDLLPKWIVVSEKLNIRLNINTNMNALNFADLTQYEAEAIDQEFNFANAFNQQSPSQMSIINRLPA